MYLKTPFICLFLLSHYFTESLVQGRYCRISLYPVNKEVQPDTWMTVNEVSCQSQEARLRMGWTLPRGMPRHHSSGTDINQSLAALVCRELAKGTLRFTCYGLHRVSLCELLHWMFSGISVQPEIEQEDSSSPLQIGCGLSLFTVAHGILFEGMSWPFLARKWQVLFCTSLGCNISVDPPCLWCKGSILHSYCKQEEESDASPWSMVLVSQCLGEILSSAQSDVHGPGLSQHTAHCSWALPRGACRAGGAAASCNHCSVPLCSMRLLFALFIQSLVTL